MPIGDAQLKTWSKHGSVAQSRDTYAAIKNVLENQDAPYSNKDFTVFLQGSYGNETNVYAESDVDIVMELQSTFYETWRACPIWIGTHTRTLFPMQPTTIQTSRRMPSPG
jgi:hypothetical protein